MPQPSSASSLSMEGSKRPFKEGPLGPAVAPRPGLSDGFVFVVAVVVVVVFAGVAAAGLGVVMLCIVIRSRRQSSTPLGREVGEDAELLPEASCEERPLFSGVVRLRAVFAVPFTLAVEG